MIIVGGFVTNAPNDKEQLSPPFEAISPVVGEVENLLVDNGEYRAASIFNPPDPPLYPQHRAISQNH